MKTPKQLMVSSNLIRSWTINYPLFYGERVTHAFVDDLFEAEACLKEGNGHPHPSLCRVLAAFHGPKGAKVPLSISTVSGCVRPAFVEVNPWLRPNTHSCYDGGCYLFHARAIPAKKSSEIKVRAHTIPQDSLLAAARVARHFELTIRDNQSSDGSMSMALPAKDNSSSQLLINLRTLCESGFTDVPYLCFSSAYCSITASKLRELGMFPNIVVHVTVSGWHSREENVLRLSEFERYAEFLPHVCLRIVNRQDWRGKGEGSEDGAAQCEDWLLGEIVRRGLSGRVIRTPFHSVHPFPGSHTGQLGTRHLAGTKYSNTWDTILPHTLGECCMTGKCKTCLTKCGVPSVGFSQPIPLLAAKAFEAMLDFEINRQKMSCASSLSLYTARILARKAKEQYETAGEFERASYLANKYDYWDEACRQANLTHLQRRRLSNDSHALVIDGIDRHGLWRDSKRPDFLIQKDVNK